MHVYDRNSKVKRKEKTNQLKTIHTWLSIFIYLFIYVSKEEKYVPIKKPFSKKASSEYEEDQNMQCAL